MAARAITGDQPVSLDVSRKVKRATCMHICELSGSMPALVLAPVNLIESVPRTVAGRIIAPTVTSSLRGNLNLGSHEIFNNGTLRRPRKRRDVPNSKVANPSITFADDDVFDGKPHRARMVGMLFYIYIVAAKAPIYVEPMRC